MSEDSSVKRGVTNSLLNVASFAFEDSALLVPVPLSDEPEILAPSPISEIDLNSEDSGSVNLLGVGGSQTISPVDNFVPLFNLETYVKNEPPKFQGFSTSGDDFLKKAQDWPPVSSSPAAPPPPAQFSTAYQQPPPPPLATTTTGVQLNHAPSPISFPPPPPPISAQPPPPQPLTTQSPTFPPRKSLIEQEITIGSTLSRPPPPMGMFSPPPPPLVGSSAETNNNSFRLGKQKPMYAKYPGLSGVEPSPPSPMYMAMPTSTQFSETAQVPTSITTFAPTPAPPAPPSSIPSASPYAFTPFNMQRIPSPSLDYASPTSHSMPVMASAAGGGVAYKPLTFHWFHRKEKDAENQDKTKPKVDKDKTVWRAFSLQDSAALEQAFSENNQELISTDGGRYDVNVHKRLKYPVYWDEKPSEVRRCSWFYKGPMDSRFVPYEETLSESLELEYQNGLTTGVWNRRLEFPGGEAIILYNATAVSHFCQAAAPDEWGNLPESQLRPRVVKRGVEEFEIEDGESSQIDHLVFLVHGIGAICDLKFRTIVEAVDDFRHLSFQLMQTHFKEAVESQRAGRIEFLPVSWHEALHGDGGIDKKLKPITLKSIPKLRNFTNDSLLDILFYTSPVYAQTIIDTVGSELNRLFNLFLSRNPTFNGYVAVAGHSLGSLILFDLLTHQPKIGRYTKEDHPESEDSSNRQADIQKTESANALGSEGQNQSTMIYTVGSGTGQPFIKYPTLEFEPTAFFALGSPIAMFVTVRGIDRLGENFHFPTCPSFFNIFHPYDPVAYRLETLIDPNFDMRPVLIPHHKGRKRFHLELKETMQRVGADIKQKFLDSLKTTWNTVYQYATFSKGENFESEIDRVLEGELSEKGVDTNSNGSADDVDQDIGLGKLNGGRRVDYVLQEAPLESFNEYLFALSSHVCYWESEDTMLMVLREIYASMGIFVEKQSEAELEFSTNLPSAPALRDITSTSSYNFSEPPQPPPLTTPTYSGGLYQPQPPTYGASSPSTVLPPNSTSAPPPLFMNPGAQNSSSTSQALFVGNPPPFSTAPVRSSPNEAGKPLIIGARPVVSPEALTSLRGMDPTAPIMSSAAPLGPPPRTGFQMRK